MTFANFTSNYKWHFKMKCCVALYTEASGFFFFFFFLKGYKN
jgi:hypothetical protein